LYKFKEVDGVLADLGVSSHQFNEGKRGFSIRFSGPLDMRMDRRQHLTAADILHTYRVEQLHKLFEKYGEVTNAKTIARHIVQYRNQASLKTIEEFRALLKPVIKGNPNQYLAKVFQALRIEVNDEITALKEMLQQARDALRSGGRIALITFHSIEDRLVKNFFRNGTFETAEHQPFGQSEIKNVLRIITKKPLTSSREEMIKNPRAGSAKLRVAEKI
jgi:16S rRNA (cytosine1402-N4)-methyltransferase